MRHFKPVMFVCLFLFLACTWDILGINYIYPSPDTIDVRLGGTCLVGLSSYGECWESATDPLIF